MSWHVVCLVGDADTYTPILGADDYVAEIVLDAPPSRATVHTNSWKVLDRHGLSPDPTAVDFYRAAVTAYTADQRINRARHSSDGWGRNIVLHLPISDQIVWHQTKPFFEDLLGFLTGDYWQLELREVDFWRPPRRERLFRRADRLHARQVSLFSGGLDSYIAAIDLLTRAEPTVFVSHYGGGTGKRASKVQNELADVLRDKFGQDLFQGLGFYVEPSADLTAEVETSSRSRSILFFGLAVLVASALQSKTKIVVPENGFVSLNVPLTTSRIGSHSTRTTHPHVLELLGSVLAHLSLGFEIENPYRFCTKGEMVVGCHDNMFLKATCSLSVSCAHPYSSRFKGGIGSGFIHCGYCVPCIIRRASVHHVGWDPVEAYSYDLRGRKPSTDAEKSHVFAYLIALKRLNHEPVLPKLIATGPLNVRVTELEHYTDVYLRGMREVEAFLRTTKA
jgi:hypothetical protein